MQFLQKDLKRFFKFWHTILNFYIFLWYFNYYWLIGTYTLSMFKIFRSLEWIYYNYLTIILSKIALYLCTYNVKKYSWNFMSLCICTMLYCRNTPLPLRLNYLWKNLDAIVNRKVILIVSWNINRFYNNYSTRLIE